MWQRSWWEFCLFFYSTLPWECQFITLVVWSFINNVYILSRVSKKSLKVIYLSPLLSNRYFKLKKRGHKSGVTCLCEAEGEWYCTWIHQSLLKGLFQLLALDVPALHQVSVHLVTYDHNTPHLLPLLKSKCSLLRPLDCGQFSHLLNKRKDIHLESLN